MFIKKKKKKKKKILKNLTCSVLDNTHKNKMKSIYDKIMKKKKSPLKLLEASIIFLHNNYNKTEKQTHNKKEKKIK